MDENLRKQLIKAMHYDEQDEWDKSHQIVQHIEHEIAYRIHAYLHRKEGDTSNANYWYKRVGIKPFTGDLARERVQLMNFLMRS